jgi:hypothetical protein
MDTGVMQMSATSIYNDGNGSYCIAAPPWIPFTIYTVTGNNTGTVLDTGKNDSATSHLHLCATKHIRTQDIDTIATVTYTITAICSAASITVHQTSLLVQSLVKMLSFTATTCH